MELEECLLEILLSHPEGLSEYDLLELLMEKEKIPNFHSSNHLMFQVHFLLFHALYKLRKVLRDQGKFDLQIHCLKIQLLPYSKGMEGLVKYTPDLLEEYYLDFNNYETPPEEVEEMLSNFWKLFDKYQKKEKALKILGLSEPVNREQVLKSYYELVRKDHPDYGGNGEKISDLVYAKSILLESFS